MVNSAKSLVAENAPVHAIGMQSHFRHEKKLDIDVIAVS
jgi:GH35 family endo-1,4-beta-xylanase